MNETITSIRPLAELLYFLSSILLIAGLYITYKQLTLIKKDIRIRNQRASAEKAIEACNRYLCEFIPKSNQNFSDRATFKIGFYKGPIGDFSNDSIPKANMEECVKRYKILSWVPALNTLEGLAAYFTTGVADESVGFRVIGRTFCSTVETNYDYIALSRKEKASGYWGCIVELYCLWRPRLTKAELELTKQIMDEKISALQEKGIAPIGTKD